jgi:hypothetical protein
MPATEAQLRAIRKYTAKNLVAERARKMTYYYANKEVLALKQKERYQKKKEAKAEIKRIDAIRKEAEAELIVMYEAAGIPAGIIQDLSTFPRTQQIYGLIDPKMLSKT